MPVVVTEYQKRPSALLSRTFTRLQRGSCLFDRAVETALLVMMQTSSAGPCTSQCTHHEPSTLRLLLSNSTIPRSGVQRRLERRSCEAAEARKLLHRRAIRAQRVDGSGVVRVAQCHSTIDEFV